MGKLRSEPSDSGGVAGAADRGSKPAAAGSSDYVEAFGTLVIGDDGAGQFYRRSSAQEMRSCHGNRDVLYDKRLTEIICKTARVYCLYVLFSHELLRISQL